jgi:predicted nucleotidyltransferase
MTDAPNLLAMDFRRPIQAVIPGAQGRILAVLAETTADLNLRTVARLAGVSPAQASRVLPDLVRLGIVERRDVPPSALFRLVDDNVASRLVRALSRVRETVLVELAHSAAALDPTPVSVIVFGSFARGDADVDSDLDAVVVRPHGVSDDDRWAQAVEDWRQFARRLTGNRVEVVDTAEDDIGRLLRSRKPLWIDIARDGVVVHGAPLNELRGRRSA